MPKRTNIKKILIIGSGAITIGQGCEFDYSGVQACKVLKEEGYHIVLINSNPATIMTDPEIADVTYIEPINWQFIEKIIAKEKPDALLPTMGGQTALNCTLELHKHGVLDKYNIELIGANKDSIEKAENREKFRQLMLEVGLDIPKSIIIRNIQEIKQIQPTLSFPVIIRPSYTLGGSGSSIVHKAEEFEDACYSGLKSSPVNEILIEEYLQGWKEFELEVIRDKNNNCIIVCTIENIDPMGIHTGDSITIAPAQTLTDKEYQKMRNAAILVLRTIGVDTGGANVQFAVNPSTGRMVVIEMNPRVSRSSALASKATGIPIARIATKLAIGYTLDELKNDMIKNIPASFEPTIDYTVIKIPRFNFDKFPGVTPILTSQMKSVGEIMAIGSTFKEAMQKALCGLELGLSGLDSSTLEKDKILKNLINPNPLRILHIADAYRVGFTTDEINKLSNIDPWFLQQIEDIVSIEQNIQNHSLTTITLAQLKNWKELGFTDKRIATLLNCTELEVKNKRHSLNLYTSFKRVDTCAAEFATETAYLYSTYSDDCEAAPSKKNKIIVLGSGPNRIGQGIEFDYCCVQAIQALKELGFEAIMINCNPETVSTDYNVADRLYFEPLTLEAILEINQVEKPLGVIVQFGGQTSLKLAKSLQQAGVNILGTSPYNIDLAENRECFRNLINRLALTQPINETANSIIEAAQKAKLIGYPIIARPSYIIGGCSMQVINDEKELENYFSNLSLSAADYFPILLDEFINDALEVDIDAVADQTGEVFIAGIMEHIEKAGVHSGDSACSLPPHTLPAYIEEKLHDYVKTLAKELNIIGLLNIQFAIKNEKIYLLEVNPRASRTVPFVSKTIGIPIAKIATYCIMDKKLAEQRIIKNSRPDYFAVKSPVFPFIKFPEILPILGPNMQSTGEVMGIAPTFHEAYGKALIAADIQKFKISDYVFLTVHPKKTHDLIEIATMLTALDIKIITTSAIYTILKNVCIKSICFSDVARANDNESLITMIKNNSVNFIINTIGKSTDFDLSIFAKGLFLHKINYATNLVIAKKIIKMHCSTYENVHSIQSLYS